MLAAANAANLAEGAKAVAAAGAPEPMTVATDLRTLDACEQLFAQVNDRFKRCDVLINNAGATKGGKFFDLPDEAWIDGFALKFFATVRLTKLFWPLLKASHGSVINIIGGAARTPGPDFLIGGSVNAAMANFAKGLTALGNRDDVNVNVIHPGATETDRVRQLHAQFAKAQGKTVEQIGAEALAKGGLRRIGQRRRISPRWRCSWRAPKAGISRVPRSRSMAAQRRGIIDRSTPPPKGERASKRAGWACAPKRRVLHHPPISRTLTTTLPASGDESDECLHNIDRAPQQSHRGFQGAEGGVRGQRHVW